MSDDASDEDKPKKQKTRVRKKTGMKEHIQEMLADLRVPDDDVRRKGKMGWAYAPESDGSINRGLVRNIVGKRSFRQIDLVCEGHEKETFTIKYFQLASRLLLILGQDNRSSINQ